MSSRFSSLWREFGPPAICRMDESFMARVAAPGGWRVAVTGSLSTVLIGAGAYGFAFGFWRAPQQAVFSAIKMPLLFVSIMLSTAMVNAMLARLLGTGLGLRETCAAVLVGMATTAAILGAVALPVAFLVFHLPSPFPGAAPVVSPELNTVYRWLMIFHVVVIAAAGLVGNVRLYRLLRRLIGGRAGAARLLIVWLAVTGFVGCELSWLFSPFLCKPSQTPHILPREYFEENFYERVWRCARGSD